MIDSWGLRVESCFRQRFSLSCRQPGIGFDPRPFDRSPYGGPIDDVIAELALRVRPVFQRVLRNHQELYFEAAGKLPNKTYVGCWVKHLFPIKMPRGKVQKIGALAVEVTELRTRGELYTNFTSQVARGANENEVARFRDLHGCIGEYKTALGLNLTSISNPRAPRRERSK